MVNIRFMGACLLLMLSAMPARADLPPPPGYVEKCTVEKVCKSNEEGDACYVYDYKQADVCKRKHASDGFVYKCQAGGGHSYTEVYCRPKAPKK